MYDTMVWQGPDELTKDSPMTSTATTRNRSFTANDGTTWTVWNERAVRSNGTFVGFADVVRTWAENEDGVQVDVEAGCSFRAERAVNNR